MATSGRMLSGNIVSMAVGASLVILDEAGKPGMLRILGLTPGYGNQNYMKIKIELDGVTIYDKDAYNFFSPSSGIPTMGQTMNIGSGSAITIDPVRRMLNIPFTKSLKITITNTFTSPHTQVWYAADYVIDVKEPV